MTTKAINEQGVEKATESKSNLLVKTVLWLATLLFLPQIILGFLSGMFFGVWQGEKFTTSAFDVWYMTISVLLTLSLISPLITISLLIKATKAETWSERFDFWAVKVMGVSEVAKWTVVGFSFWFISSILGWWIKIPEEQFMLDIKAASNSTDMIILILFTLCLVVPIMEELIFRGWLFSKVAQTKLGNIGALLLTAFVFTTIHSQYEHVITFLMLLSFGLLLGFVRYKSNNTCYTINIHALFNTLTLTTLLLN
ncbi:CPBP family intramembrane metalloprotease [Colwellia demingiae]|uniref:CPBP family intramembrane metalloprotease n=1 Tax=Colwellia demingiae TaxID=89401 RepID=A0A5C6QI12_9GAMM|nr:CPBP family intramembrane glutamic endopeptidase [Colwellia demingiae]TWX68491.1 CPBP family intramembrane metalloprotease [Colwellia demingiae]